MKPKLIVINGSLAVGKTTLAKRYVDEHPLALNLDIDQVWFMLGQWKEQRDISTVLSKEIALAMARVNLDQGYDVVVPQIVQTQQLAESFSSLAKDCNANCYEVLLNVGKDEAIERYKQRNREAGYLDGFKPGSVIESEGREVKLSKMYDNMMNVAMQRSQTIRIVPQIGDIDSTYKSFAEKLK